MPGGTTGRLRCCCLGRYRHLQPLNLGSLAKQYPGLRFTYMTVHRSKGLEADYAVVLGLCAGKHGFPVEIRRRPTARSGDGGAGSAFQCRGAAAALCRADPCAPPRCFLLAEGGPPSAFVKELIGGGYDVTTFGRPPEGRRALPTVQGRAARTPGKRWRREHLLRLLELALLRTHRAPVPEMRNRPAGKVWRRLPLPRLRRVNRGLSFLRRLAGNEDGPVRSLPRMFELSGLRLHAQSATTRSPVRKTVDDPENRTAQAALTCRHSTGLSGRRHGTIVRVAGNTGVVAEVQVGGRDTRGAGLLGC